MGEIDRALDRLSRAVAELIDAPPGSQDGEVAARIAALTAERDRLRAEVEALEAQREEDARLRAEAAEAVRDALSDLNGLVGAQQQAN
jgi:hypothetical protein